MRLFQKGQRGTKIFYATDVHGSERTWKKFLNAAKFYGADVLVMGGDIMGKLAIPIIREAGGGYRATVHGRVERVTSDAEVAAIRGLIGDLGFYDVVMDEDEYRATQADPEAVEQLFVRLATERVQRWIDLAETRLAGTGIKVYATGGNDDLTEVMATMDRTDTKAFVACEDRAVPLDDDHVMISMPYVNPTPWKTPREDDEAGLAARIDALARRSATTARSSSTSTRRPPIRRLTPARCSTHQRIRRVRSSREGNRSCTAREARRFARRLSTTNRCSAFMAISTNRRPRRSSGGPCA